MEISVERGGGLFEAAGEKQTVWMSHGDEAVYLPDGFHVTARSQQGSVAAIESPERRLYGLQYHPEVLFGCRIDKILNFEILSCFSLGFLNS